MHYCLVNKLFSRSKVESLGRAKREQQLNIYKLKCMWAFLIDWDAKLFMYFNVHVLVLAPEKFGEAIRRLNHAKLESRPSR